MISGLVLKPIQHIFHVDLSVTFFCLSLSFDPTYVQQKFALAGRERDAQVPIILRRHILVLLDPPRPREILHPELLSLVHIHRPGLCYLQDSQHLCRDRPPRWGIIPETRHGACVVVVFNEDPVRKCSGEDGHDDTMPSPHPAPNRHDHKTAVSYSAFSSPSFLIHHHLSIETANFESPSSPITSGRAQKGCACLAPTSPVQLHRQNTTQ